MNCSTIGALLGYWSQRTTSTSTGILSILNEPEVAGEYLHACDEWSSPRRLRHRYSGGLSSGNTANYSSRTGASQREERHITSLLSRLPSRSIIPACDTTMTRLEQVIAATALMDDIGAYKFGAALSLEVGLPDLVAIAKSIASKKPVIYDHQKAGTDIPDTAGPFMQTLARAGVDAVILFPFTGPETQSAWTKAAKDLDLGVIIGAYMTHDNFLVDANGYIPLDSVLRIYQQAAEAGVADFMVPGNRPEVIRTLRSAIAKDVDRPVFYAPGFVSQGGEISEAAKVAGENWHAIVGRAIYDADDISASVLSLAKHLRSGLN